MKKFTLVEMLVVLAIIGLLISILLPSLTNAREMAKQAVCMSNQKQVNIALFSYYSKNDQRFPYGIANSFQQLKNNQPANNSTSPSELLMEFLTDPENFVCPSDESPENFKWWVFRNKPNFETNNNEASYMWNEWSVWLSSRYLGKTFRVSYLQNPAEIFQLVDGNFIVSGGGFNMGKVSPLANNPRIDWYHPKQRVSVLFGDGHVGSVDALQGEQYKMWDY